VIEFDKTALRRALRAARRTADYTQPDAALCRAAHGFLQAFSAQAVLLFWPQPGEVDLHPLIEQLWADRTPLYFPRCLPGRQLCFGRADSQDDLLPDAFGIPAPPPDAPLWTPETGRTVCIVPALAFDRQGYRLGYGGGYYDRFLSLHPTLHTLGLCRTAELLSALPRESHDRPVHTLLTETARLEVNRP
jgi:5-formyltetrahydrofolate cyclo-ligase